MTKVFFYLETHNAYKLYLWSINFPLSVNIGFDWYFNDEKDNYVYIYIFFFLHRYIIQVKFKGTH